MIIRFCLVMFRLLETIACYLNASSRQYLNRVMNTSVDHFPLMLFVTRNHRTGDTVADMIVGNCSQEEVTTKLVDCL